MSLWRLVTREIVHRKLNFALGVAGVFVAVGVLVAQLTILRAHDLRTEQIVQAKLAETERKVRARQAEADDSAAKLNEAFRKIMLKFGYNLLILPQQEKLVDYRVQGGPSKYMDEKNVRILSDSKIMTVRHLLPVLQQRQVLVFGDKRQEVFLVGTRGEVPLAHRAPKKPLLAAVGPGDVILGHDVHRELGAGAGDRVKVVDREFTVSKVYEPRGTRDDSSAWIDLTQVQELLGKPGRINAILALSCICTRAQLDDIIKDIERILPGTQVRAMISNATIRYESRLRAAAEAKARVELTRRQGVADIEAVRRDRRAMKGEMEAFAAWVVPLILVGSAVWTALLALGNVRERRSEIGVLRVLGLRSRQVFTIFLAKAVLTGLAGACAGYGAGLLVASAWPQAPQAAGLLAPLLPAVILPLAALLSAAAGWVPAMLAARQDPAVVLREQ